MTDVNMYLKDNLPGACKSGRLFIAPEIPEKKLNNAVSAFQYDGSPNAVVAIIDTTAMGSAKNGILFTGEKLICRNLFEDPRAANYYDIQDIEAGDKKIRLNIKGDEVVVIDEASEFDHEKLFEILTHIISNDMEYAESNQMLTLAEMSERLKMAYLQVIVNSTHSDDGEVDSNELSEILMLMTRLELASATRFEVRSYISSASDGELAPLRDLLAIIDSECPPGQLKPVHISLVKDLISVYKSTKDSAVSGFTFLHENLSHFSVTDKEIELAVMAIENDRKMLSGDYDDDAITKNLKELSSKAAAVGVPLGAVYLSGSVVGMSAAGLTSGLATLGFGGALGLSSMATGIGVAVLLGVGAYKGMRHITGANELDKSKRRSMMLTEVIKQTQKTTSLLMSDINFLVSQLNEKDVQLTGMSEKVKRIVAQLQSHTKAGKLISERSQGLQASQSKLGCPRILDLQRLHNLTEEPTKKAIRELIINAYERTSNVDKTTEGEQENCQLVIKSDLSVAEADQMAHAFKAIGYFDVTADLSGTASKLTDGAKHKLKGLFS